MISGKSAIIKGTTEGKIIQNSKPVVSGVEPFKTCGERSRTIQDYSKGFTITEIVLILAIVGIFISGIIPLFLNVVTINKSSDYYSKAYKALDSKIEEYRNSDFNSITTGNFSIPDLPPGNTGTATVTSNIDGAPQADIKQITITINWTFKKSNQVKAVTYIARNGLKR